MLESLLPLLLKRVSMTSKRPKRARPCIVCKKPHVANNAFCSAECCAKHKVKPS